MTQVSRYGHLLKVKIDGMRMRVAAPERVARVVRSAERGCFGVQALANPVPVTTRTLLNGAPLGAAPR
jgi:hypothetical protein